MIQAVLDYFAGRRRLRRRITVLRMRVDRLKMQVEELSVLNEELRQWMMANAKVAGMAHMAAAAKGKP